MNTPVNPQPVGDAWPRRRAKAARTRAAIIDAARELFVATGYLGTSIQDVADRARVSRATVFNSVGGKVQLLRAAYDVALVGDDEPVPLPQRPEARAVIDAPDQVQAIERYAALTVGVNRRLHGIYEALRAAAGADPEVRAHWAQIQQERLGGARGFTRIVEQKGPLRPGIDRDRAADAIWTLLDASLYAHLVVERGWSPEELTSWLSQRMRDELLPRAPDPRRPRRRSTG
ncbi:MAG TPA: helix-turn-helix domain-containing protein [Mycobacteriales bacterium]|nr:helix-turn-helix domain-containing protein [Mycobacteriales bacterium]